MSLGLGDKFDILKQSPYDLRSCGSSAQVKSDNSMTRWVPSRYNVRATDSDGRMILWNTYRNTMSVFQREQRELIESLLLRKGFTSEPEGVVKYLFDRGYLLKDGADEYRQFQLSFGQQHYRTDTLELILLASEDCNFRCHYCYEEFARGTMQPAVRQGIKKLVEKRLSGLRNLSISWFGGEPLYGFSAIEELAPFFLKTAKDHSLSFSSNMTTNAFLLSPGVAEKLLAWQVNRYQITIDGPPEHHDQSRPTRDGQGTFSTIFENLKALSSRSDDYVVDIRVNFDRSNYSNMDQFFDLLEKEFRDDTRFRLRFRAVGRWGGANDEQLDVCGRDEGAQVLERLKKEALDRGLIISSGDDIRKINSLGSQVCYAARPYNFVIGASGKIMKCTIDLDMYDRNVVGQLAEDGKLSLDREKLALWTEAAFEGDTKCQKCVALPACQGIHCPLIRIEKDESPCTPLRMNLKKELRGILENIGDGKREVTITGQRVEVTPITA